MADQLLSPVVPVVRSYAEFYGPYIGMDQLHIIDDPVCCLTPAAYDLPPEGYAFRFYDRVEVKIVVGGVAHELRSEPFNYSPYFYPGGQALTLAEQTQAFSERGDLSGYRNDRFYKGYANYVALRTRHGQVLFVPGPVEFIPDKTAFDDQHTQLQLAIKVGDNYSEPD